jgi:hypothetical protein
LTSLRNLQPVNVDRLDSVNIAKSGIIYKTTTKPDSVINYFFLKHYDIQPKILS